jgi:Tfp pilus assembly protein PilF
MTTTEQAFDFNWEEASVSPELVPVPTEKKYTKQQADVLLQQGIDFHKQGKTKEAMEIYKEILFHDRGNHKALYFTAIALSQENHPEEQVLALMRHAVKQAENVPEAHYNLGILLHRMGKEEEAMECFKKAIKMMPKLTEAKVSLAGCYLNMGEKEQGKLWLQAAASTLSQQPDSVYSRAFAKLTLGDIYGGWVDYDTRWKTASFLVENRRDFGAARHWNGQPIPGKNLYIHTEQGAGDVVMFSRFIEQVAERSQAKTITFEIGDSLIDFLAQVKGVDYVIPSNSPVPAEAMPVHYYLPLMGMMRKISLFDYKKIPYADGWLKPMPGSKLEVPQLSEGVLKVGVAWAGSKFHKNDRYRSIPWQQFRDALLMPFKDNTQVGFYSFQVGERARDIDDTPGLVMDLTPEMKNFNDTAYAASQMDLMICVDTATVHVAAALENGPPVWMLVPAAPDWRWLLEGWETKWYSRVTLFRQEKFTDWQSILELVQKNLASFVDEVGATR